MLEFLRRKKEVVQLEQPETKVNPPLGQMTLYQANRISMLGKTPVAYNPDAITIPTYNDMRNFDTIAGALAVNKFPIMSVDWRIKGSNPQRVDFVNKNLRPLFSEFMKDMMLALSFGYAPFEKVWEIKGDRMTWLKKLLALNPQRTDCSVQEDGSFNGLVQFWNVNSSSPILIPANKSFVFTREKEFGNFYGRPITRGAYTPWYIIRYALEFTNIFYEKYGNPTLAGYAPNTQTKVGNKTVNTMDYMLDVMKSIQSASAVVLPHNSNKKDELEYFIEVLESKRTGADFISYLDYLDKKIFIGCLVPGLALDKGDKGSYGLAEEQMAAHAQRIDGELTCIKEHLDKYIIKPLISYNFNDWEQDDTEWSFSPIARKDKEMTRSVMVGLIQNGYVKLALRYLTEMLGMPGLEAGEKLSEWMDDPVEKVPANPAEQKVNQGKKFTRAGREKIILDNSQEARLREVKKKIDYKEIKKRYNDNEALIIAGLIPIVSKMKEGLIKDIRNAVDNGKIKDIQNMGLRYKSEYQQKVIEVSKKVFNDGRLDVEKEMGLEDTAIPQDASNWLVARAKNIANKHMSDLEFIVIGTALNSLSKDLSGKQIVSDASNSFTDYIDNELQDSAGMINQKMYGEGRSWTMEENGAKFAMWVADPSLKHCDYCGEMEGTVISVDDPDFSEFGPCNVHDNCGCQWYPLEGDNWEPDWQTPSKTTQKEFYMSRRHVCSKQ